MTTEELIAEIERLDAAATAGPWRVFATIRRGGDGRTNSSALIDAVISEDETPFVAEALIADEDAELIASYRTLAVEAAKRLREAERLLKADEMSRAILWGAEPQ